MLYQIECLLDTRGQPNSVENDLLPVRWAIHRQAAGNAHLGSVSNDPIDVIGETNLHVPIGDHISKATFHIVNKLAAGISFGTSFIDENIVGMLPKSKESRTMYV